MSFRGLYQSLAADRSVAEAISDAKAAVSAVELDSPAAGRPALIATLAETTGRPLLVVTSTFREAEQLTAVLQSLLGETAAVYYPAWETLPHERLSPRSDTVGRRLAVLRAITG
ncbi:MAG: hypothetical protein KDB34_10245, partial [Propionibacteriaceae bacterium]|nr:hypothetical protein [Propionibacteriaceae bacterium]